MPTKTKVKRPHGQTRALKHFAAPKPAETGKLAHATQSGQASFDAIREWVGVLLSEDASEDEKEAARQSIHEDPLSVMVRSGWYAPGTKPEAPWEYEILLSTGGPAVRIIGELSQHAEPTSAHLEVQDWFQPWTEIRPMVAPDNYDAEPIMLEYAQQFYYGE